MDCSKRPAHHTCKRGEEAVGAPKHLAFLLNVNKSGDGGAKWGLRWPRL